MSVVDTVASTCTHDMARDRLLEPLLNDSAHDDSTALSPRDVAVLQPVLVSVLEHPSDDCDSNLHSVGVRTVAPVPCAGPNARSPSVDRAGSAVISTRRLTRANRWAPTYIRSSSLHCHSNQIDIEYKAFGDRGTCEMIWAAFLTTVHRRVPARSSSQPHARLDLRRPLA